MPLKQVTKEHLGAAGACLVSGNSDAPQKRTVRGLIEEYLTDCKLSLSPATVHLYRYNLSRVADFLHERGVITADQLQPTHLRAFLANMRRNGKNGDGVSPATLDQYWRTLNTFLNWAVAEGAIADNPMKRVRRPKLPKHKVDRLDRVQAARLITLTRRTALPDRNEAIVSLLLDTGLRVGELVRLKLSDVDLDRGIVRVKGKGGKEREVPLEEASMAALRRYLGKRPQVETDVLFLTRHGKPLTGNSVRLLLRRLRDKLGVDRLYPHLLRHTFARLYLEQGDLRSLQAILGHASVSTTANIYLDPDIDDLKRKHRRASPLNRIVKSILGRPRD